MKPRRVALIGGGAIGSAVAVHVASSPSYRLTAILVRRAVADGEGRTGDPDRFFASGPDLIIEVAGPEALRQHGERALLAADLWTVSASALADDPFRERLEQAARSTGHRLRLPGGAMPGLDGVAAARLAGASRLAVTATRPGIVGHAGPIFAGPLRGALALHPNELNFAVAAALAGPGIDRTEVMLADGPHRLTLSIDGPSGSLSIDVDLTRWSKGALHPVAASVIAALEDEARPFRFG